MSQEKLYNKHSVYTHCNECKMFGINLPDDRKCGNCNSEDTNIYYHEEDIDYAVQHRNNKVIEEAMKKFENKH